MAWIAGANHIATAIPHQFIVGLGSREGKRDNFKAILDSKSTDIFTVCRTLLLVCTKSNCIKAGEIVSIESP